MQILTDRQVVVLKAIGAEKQLAKYFYLTGGTPLAAFYLGHRLSEDLDFFSEEEVDPLAIRTFFQIHKKEWGIKKIDTQQSFNRNLFFLHFVDEILKMEFTYFPFPRIEKGMKKYGITIDSLEDIAVNKVFTIYQRTKARDYIDLYVLCKKEGFSITDLVKRAQVKFDWYVDPLQLGAQFQKAREAPDLPRMVEEIAPEVWQTFFEKEAKKLKTKILRA